METILGVAVVLVVGWLVLKASYFILLMVWEEVGPAVLILWRVVKWLLYLPLSPFVSLWHLIFGYPETEEERHERLRQERMAREQGEGDRQREEQLEAIRQALKID